MYISRLKLVNFEGIRQGLDKKELEIVFDADRKITMLSGANGSGKSTIMSQLQPFKESFDDRKNLITDGEDGIKEVDIYHGDDFYEIVHYYTTPAQSYIKKNGVELNENGGVKTCEEIISRELGITKNYFNIGKIGSNTRNFIEFTTTERKNYIGTFLNIDEITNATKMVQEKSLALRKDISNLALDLKTLPERDIMVEKLNVLVEAEKILSDEISKLYTSSGEISGIVSVLKKSLEGISVSNLTSEKSTLSSQINTANKDISIFLEKYPNVTVEDAKGEIAEIEARITELKNTLSSLETELKFLGESLEEDKNGQKKSSLARAACKSLDELAIFENEVEKKKAEMETAKKDAESSPLYGKIAELFKKGMNTVEITSQNRDLNDFLQFILKEFGNFKNNNIFKLQTNYLAFMTESTIITVLKHMLENTLEIIAQKEAKLENLKSMRELQQSYVSKIRSLTYRPETCVDNSCPFIKEAYEHRDAPDKIIEIEREIETVKNDLAELKSQETEAEYLITLEKEFRYRWKKISENALNNIYCEFSGISSMEELVSKGTTESNLQTSTTGFYNAVFDLISKLTTLANKKQNYLVISRDYESVKSSNDGALIEKYDEEISEYSKKIDDTQKKIAQSESKLNEIKKMLSDETSKLELFRKYYSSKNMFGTLEERLGQVVSSLEEANKLSREIAKSEKDLIALNDTLAKRTKEKETMGDDIIVVSTTISTIDNINEKMANLQKEYEPVETIQTALSTSKGIPLILMQLYLERTELIANELLSLAYDGDFEISFKTSAKDFFIQVRSKENVKNDIKLASQGETSLTAISLSLALIEQSIGDYNILCLDEIDGPLDKKNREKFINILETQIEKLGIEQVFIISHNDAFDACSMNLILLNGSTVDTDNASFMQNKKILFQNH